MAVEYSAFAGWKKNLKLANDSVELIKNEYTVTVSQVTESPRTLRREMILSLDQTGPGVIVEHRLTNESGSSLLVAPWALSVMAPGGCAIIPQPQPGKHPDDFVPNRAVILWPFTDFSDQRLLVGRHIIRLRQETGPPIKFGLRLTEGWAAYFENGHLFVKSVPFLAEEIYPDLGSNFEAFANAEFLELETLGPLKPLLAGETVVHRESWVVFSDVTPPPQTDEEALRQWMEPYVRQLPEKTSQ